MEAAKLSAIVLAGRREGRIEPLAEAFGETEKCLVPVAGIPLIEHVLKTLSTCDRVGKIIVSINDPQLIATLPVASALIRERRLIAVAAKGNLADSVLDAASHADFPLVITTADNVLLTSGAVAEFERVALRQRADAAVAFAKKASILATHADGQRRFYEFADDGYSNCNCYWIANQGALSAAETFRSGGQFAKNPMRIVSVFGLWNLIRFRLGCDTLARAFERISNRMGLKLFPVVFNDGSLAIDVDNERTHRVVTEILERRAQMRDAA
jgi:GTP:adenosylcobinamide-phosphate guanylyltransferase